MHSLEVTTELLRLTTLIDLPLNIVKKNSRPIHGRGLKKWIGKSPKLKNAEEYLTLRLKSLKNELKLETIKGDIRVAFTFYMPNYYNKDGTRNRTMTDLSNLIELPADCLQAAGIIENDTDIVSLDGSRRVHAIESKLGIEIWQFI